MKFCNYKHLQTWW